MVLADAEDVQPNLVGEFYLLHQVAQALRGIDSATALVMRGGETINPDLHWRVHYSINAVVRVIFVLPVSGVIGARDCPAHRRRRARERWMLRQRQTRGDPEPCVEREKPETGERQAERHHCVRTNGGIASVDLGYLVTISNLRRTLLAKKKARQRARVTLE